MEDRKIQNSAIITAIADYAIRHPELKGLGKSYGEILALAIEEKINTENYKPNQN